MGRYPRTARNAQLKCIACNAPVVETVGGEYACVSCGDAPIKPRKSGPARTVTSRAKSATTDD